MLKLEHIHKVYKTGTLVQRALDDVSLAFRDSEFVAILGPSGSGKTTLLNIIGGLDRYDSGDIVINGVSTKKYRDRDWDSYRNRTIGFVFQSYNLIPHQTILSNVELALTISGIRKKERRARAKEALFKVGLGDQLHKKPNQLSGGQMQRVAIARALVNDPTILLADEPTGALDSETSIQVMELLKEVAKDRLVVMVTHNPELADRYATRIVNLKDGKILGDTDPFEAKEDLPPVHRNLGKAVMHFLTALGLSFNNLLAKYKRTVLVAFAGSIGITGIALILSLSNGVNNYIAGIEESAITEYPLTISGSSVNMAALLSSPSASDDDAEVREMKTVSELFSKVEKNDLTSLKAYFESDEKPLSKSARAIEYRYNLTPQIFRLETDKNGKEQYRQVNPDQTMSALGISVDASLLEATSYSLDVFSALPREDSLYKSKYEVKAGTWPSSPYECVLVISAAGRISDLTLYAMGMKDVDILNRIIRNYLTGKNSKEEVDALAFHYTDFLGVEFRIVNAASYYAYDAEFDVYTDNRENPEHMLRTVREGKTLTVVGVVMPKEDSDATILSSGICYEPELIDELVREASESAVVKAQLMKPEKDVISGQEFGAVDRGSLDLLSLFSVNEKAIIEAFKFDPSALKLNFGGMDLSSLLNGSVSLDGLLEKLKQAFIDEPIDFEGLREALSTASFRMSAETAASILREAMMDFFSFLQEDPEMGIEKLIDRDAWDEAISRWAETERAQEIIRRFTEDSLLSETRETIDRELGSISDEVRSRVNEVIASMLGEISAKIGARLQVQMQAAMESLATELPKAISIDTDALMSAVSFNMSEQELASLLNSILNAAVTTLEGNLSKMGYVDLDAPSRIAIYSYDFKTKSDVKEVLNAYNQRMEDSGESGKVIRYTDLVGTLMSSVETIVNVVSYVLIGFVAISLIVSSIMIAVITYISVLERRKEIGILRAIGASKNNVKQVFNAETVIIGFLSGIFGVGFSLLYVMIINLILATYVTEVYIRAVLTVPQCVILILISIFLSMVSGLIPAGSAAKQDPVLALRSE